MIGKICQSCQFDQTSRCRTEATFPVEVGQMRFEIDMEPLGAAFSGNGNRLLDQARAYPAVPVSRMDGCIEDGGMPATVPGDIDEANETLTVAGTKIREAPRKHRAE